MPRTTPIAYISGPLQAASDLEVARRLYEKIAQVCEACGFRAYLPHNETDPYAHADVSPSAVFKRDIDAMRGCDVVIAHIGAPSSGVGAELAFAFDAGQPIVGLWREGERPSRFIEGMLRSYDAATMATFGSEAELEEQLQNALRVAAARLFAQSR